MTALLPAEITSRRVVARYLNLVADGPEDPDALPDGAVPTGDVRFTRVADGRVWADTTQSDGTTVRIAKGPIVAKIDPATGEIGLAHDPAHGVKLPVGLWSVEERVAGRPAKPWVLDVTDGEGIIDLHTQAPVTPDPTTVLVPSIETMERAEAAADRAEAAAADAAGAVGEGIADAVADWLVANPLDADPAGTAAAAVQAHEGAADPHPQYVTESELPAPPDLSGYVTNNDPRLSDARTPTKHDHPEYLTEADLPDVSDVIREGDARLSDARTPLAHEHTLADVRDLTDILAGKSDTAHSHTWDTIAAKPSAFPPAEHDHDGDYYTKAQSDAALGALPVLRYAVVTVPNVGWADSVTLLVDGLTGVHWVTPVTADDAATWAAGGWWASSPADGELTITGEIQSTADPVDIRVVWWGEKKVLQ